MPTVPIVFLLTVDADADPAFHRVDGVRAEVYPCLLDADNLRDAAVLSSRCEDVDARAPVPLLRIDTTRRAAVDADPAAARPTEIAFPAPARLLAGLIADAVRVGVATGAVIRTGDEQADDERLRADVAEHLRRSGFGVAFGIEGWRMYDGALMRAS